MENIFHASKIFENGGPFTELLSIPTHKVKRDSRLIESGKLIGFSSRGKIWPLTLKTIFYDCPYLNALSLQQGLAFEVGQYNAFTDTGFNSKKLNCQAKSAALFVSLSRKGLLMRITATVNTLGKNTTPT